MHTATDNAEDLITTYTRLANAVIRPFLWTAGAYYASLSLTTLLFLVQ